MFGVSKPKANNKIIFYDTIGWNAEMAAASWENEMKANNVFYYKGGYFDWQRNWGFEEWKSWVKATKYGLYADKIDRPKFEILKELGEETDDDYFPDQKLASSFKENIDAVFLDGSGFMYKI